MHDTIKERAAELGFDLFGIATVRPLDRHGDRLIRWLKNGHHSGMTYMERNREKRINPGLLVPGSRSVIVAGMNYYHEYNPPENKPVFARYALGKDYHRILKDRLNVLLEFIKVEKPGIEGRVFVDTHPVLERAWAQAAGLGWIGKNSMLINREKGSFFFIGILIINIELKYDKPAARDYCGNCTRCLEACPTSAILENRTIDSNRCLSYLTIENKEDIPPEYAEKARLKIFGCDICQEVCPWNHKAIETTIKEFEPLPEILDYTTDQWKSLSEEEFYHIFSGSAVMRAGYKGFMRNVRSGT
ncbi:MAG TPA: tRNA epoxyqueuosine(34) reductase QueG [Bacteroidales bacterium]|nr:tRNA epoxyqueuosine(34) reductase QueG [Bacteroidales bacterium]